MKRYNEYREHLDRANLVLSELCLGEREWLMSIPVRPEHDPDLIIGAALNDLGKLITEAAALEARVKELEGMLKLKQDDWIEVCKENDALEARVKELGKDYLEAQETLSDVNSKAQARTMSFRIYIAPFLFLLIIYH